MAKTKNKSELSQKDYYCEMYKIQYHFFNGTSVESFLNFMNKKFKFKPKDNLGDGLTVEFVDEEGFVFTVIWVRKKNDYPVVAHECCHAAMNHADSRGLLLKDGEAICYIVENLYRKFIS